MSEQYVPKLRQRFGTSEQRLWLRRFVNLTGSQSATRVFFGRFSKFRATRSAVRQILGGLRLMPSAFVGPGTDCRERTA